MLLRTSEAQWVLARYDVEQTSSTALYWAKEQVVLPLSEPVPLRLIVPAEVDVKLVCGRLAWDVFNQLGDLADGADKASPLAIDFATVQRRPSADGTRTYAQTEGHWITIAAVGPKGAYPAGPEERVATFHITHHLAYVIVVRSVLQAIHSKRGLKCRGETFITVKCGDPMLTTLGLPVSNATLLDCYGRLQPMRPHAAGDWTADGNRRDTRVTRVDLWVPVEAHISERLGVGRRVSLENPMVLPVDAGRLVQAMAVGDTAARLAEDAAKRTKSDQVRVTKRAHADAAVGKVKGQSKVNVYFKPRGPLEGAYEGPRRPKPKRKLPDRQSTVQDFFKPVVGVAEKRARHE